MAALDAEFETLGDRTCVSASKIARVCPKSDMNLTDALLKVRKRKTLGVTIVADAFQAAGVHAPSANFRTIVNQNLIRNGKLFKNVSPGR